MDQVSPPPPQTPRWIPLGKDGPSGRKPGREESTGDLCFMHLLLCHHRACSRNLITCHGSLGWPGSCAPSGAASLPWPTLAGSLAGAVGPGVRPRWAFQLFSMWLPGLPRRGSWPPRRRISRGRKQKLPAGYLRPELSNPRMSHLPDDAICI